MKKLFSVLAIAISTQFCVAQITLTQADYASINDTIIIANDTMPTISIGNPGLQTWDFSTLQNHLLDTVVYLDATTTANGGDFTSNLALDRATQMDYFTSSASQYTFDGFAGDPAGLGVVSSFVFSNTQLLMAFPATHLDSQADNSYGSTRMADPGLSVPPFFVVDSVMINHNGISTGTLDAFGNLILPTGTFDVLRQSAQEISIDSILIKTSDPTTSASTGIPLNTWGMAPVFPGILDANPVIDTAFIYKWIANGEKHPLVEVRTDAPNGAIISLEYQVGGAVLVNLIPNDISCPGMCDGQITVTPTVGIAPFTYQWDDNNLQTNAVATGLCAGTYNVTVIDVLNDTAFAAMTLNDPIAIATQTIGGYVQCAGDINTGVISITPVGGTGPFTYLWNNGSTDAMQTGLGLSTYALTITDASGCTHDTVFTIMNPDTLEGDITITDVLCFGESSGTASFIATGGMTPYAFNWSNGSMTDSSGTVAAGAISVTATDGLGCITNSNITVNEPSELLVSITYTQIGVWCDFSFNSIVSGGSGPYNYAWTHSTGGGTVSDSATIASITMFSGVGMSDTLYLVVTDSTGCSGVTQITDLCYVGIEEKKASYINIFPNPTTGIFTIELENNKITHVSIQDITGKEVYSTTINESQKTIDISHLKSGNYILHLSNDKNAINRQLILIK
ncbi:MAG: T9SS type A sorting domain-containing protein [Flavobacteriales bacterium]|nr:T9SS type A sorting domain-containing protein [Flavobacteriales bacterium]